MNLKKCGRLNVAELQKVDDWLSAFLANLEPAARGRMMRQLAQELRRTQQQNIRMQRNPDGSSYEPRRVTARSKKGRIKRQMFAKLRTTKYLKTAASADSASVQFEGKVQRIARVHHYGLRDRVSRKGPEVRYAERRLLGYSNNSYLIVSDLLMKWLTHR
ncbi:phage virion morphogenesis protein [Salmonella enterica]|nr:phage virion morphogenesis protein [Salmonella enterica]